MFTFTDYTPWSLFVDLGLISFLMLIGKIARVKIKLIQKLFIPPSLIAGVLVFALKAGGALDRMQRSLTPAKRHA